MPDIELYRTVLRQLPDTAVLVVDQGRQVLLAEGGVWPAGAALPDARFGRPLHEVLPAALADRLGPLVDEAIAGASGGLELTDAAGRVFEFRSAPFAGALVGALLVSRDLTAQRRLEAELRRAQKLEAVGTLASGVAHDYNNLLMGMLGCADLALRFTAADSRARPFLEELKKAALRGGTLTRQLLLFSRRGEAPPSLVRLDGLVEESERMLRTALGDAVRLKVTLNAGRWVVNVDPGRLQQVLMNLVLNARDALPEGGTVTLSTAEERLETDDPGCPEGLPPGEYGVLSLADDGVGMAPEVLARAFEPFFTTKGAGGGTGLGLASVFAIVEQAGGRITVASASGVGTLFRVYLPRVHPALATPAARPAPTPPDTAALSVLVVDDEPLVRLTLRAFLEPLGHRVAEACDHAEAALICRRSDPAVDLVITDVMLPGATGAEVAALVTSRFPTARVVFMSAHPVEMLVEGGRIPAGAPFLEKPFDEEALASAVAQALTQAPRGPRHSD